ncbi:flagellar biosynthetic protein FliR [Nocardioides panacis]|uniref:Flagellar biosynthetic protein FliR n=1 Tax=Nocardioides panacis TaxID=2849501 RepID=A0A975SZ72_9ACTN|nr:flagellar biosynthetic protein FliR [Nocardioides panacis]QWZ08502.1 flagellar biosynthetic protein FliR [Nocardioides panacis]
MVVTIAGAPVIAYVLASVRLVAWLLVAPPFSSKAVPTLAKTLLALGMAFAVVPGMDQGGIPEDTAALIGLALQEALIGASMGFVTFLVFSAIQAAGDLIDVFGGFSLAAAFDPLSQNMNSVHGKLFSMLGMMLLFTSNLHLLVIGGLLRSFETMPVGTAWQPSSVTEVVTVAFSMFFAAAVQIALPLIGVLFLADLGLALLTRVAPQLNAIGIMFPAKIGLTLLMVGVSFAVLPDATLRLLETLSQAMTAFVSAS